MNTTTEATASAVLRLTLTDSPTIPCYDHRGYCFGGIETTTLAV